MSHTFPTNGCLRNLYAASVADNTLITDFLVFSTVTFPVFARSENSFAEQTVFFRFQGSVVNGFRFLYFTAGPFSDFFRRGQTNLDRIKCNWLIPFVCLILWHLRYSLPSILHRNPLLIRQQIPAPPQKVLLQHLQVPRSQHRTPAL